MNESELYFGLWMFPLKEVNDEYLQKMGGIAFGILSYSLILVCSLANILVPQNATVLTMVNTISMIFLHRAFFLN